MTTQEIMQKYVAYYGLHYSRGGTDDISPLMPYFLMDIGYQYYCRDILALKVKHGLKKARTAWSDAYNSFNSALFLPFPDMNDQCEITDIIDDLNSSIVNDLTVAQVSAMNCFDNLTFEQQTVLSSVLMTNMMASKAQDYWAAIYQCRNRCIDGVLHGTQEFASEYLKNLGERDSITTDDKVKVLLSSSDILNRKVIKWYNTRTASHGLAD